MTERMGSSVDKGFVDGTHRLIAPEETLSRIEALAPSMGVTRVANVTGLDRLGVPVVTVSRPNARSLSVTQGKGLTLSAAKVSGLMEAIESYHAERITLPLKLASAADLREHALVDVDRLAQLSVSSFDAHQRILWVEGTDILRDRPLWIPYEVVHTDFTLPLPSGSGAFVMSSNGLASGNHHLEAISHGICELVERDAITLFRATPRERRRYLDLDTVTDSGCEFVLSRFASADLAVAVWDMTTDIGLPSFLCAIVDRKDDPFRRMYANQGMGCHPDRSVALLRALTEAAQSRLTFITGARDDADRERYQRVRSASFIARWRDEITKPAGPRCAFADSPTFEHRTLDEDVSVECARLVACGLSQIAFVDLTRPEFAIPVVRVVVPGLEPLDEVPGYQPGPRARRARGVAV